MNPFETIRLSFKAILSNKSRSFLTMLGITIGVLSVILLTALVSGLKTTITSQVAGLGSNLIYIIPGKLTGGRGPGGVQVDKLTLNHSNSLKSKLVGEADISPVVQKVTKVSLGSRSNSDVNILGVDANFPTVLQAIKMSEGRFFTASEVDSDKKVVVIGKTVEKNLFPGVDNPLGQQIRVGDLKYTVVGSITPLGSVLGQDRDNSVVIPLGDAQKQFGINNLTTIYVNAKNPSLVEDVKNKSNQVLSKSLSSDDFSIIDQAQTLSTINQITGVLTAGLGGIAAISLLVGGIGIMNIMLVSVTERTREIGLRKALGAKPSDIRNQFLVEALTLSGLGGIIGILLGILISFGINVFLQTTITWWSVLLSFGFSMFVGIVFGVTPALRASKLNPIQALRYE